MKKIILFLACFFTLTLASAETLDKKINFNNLPKLAQTIIKKHFPDNKVRSVEKDDDRTYDVDLAGGIKLEFGPNGHWREIESEKAGIPYSALPQRVRAAVKSKYNGKVKVVEVEREEGEIKVKLSNGDEFKMKNSVKGKKAISHFEDNDD